jgi:hypothetical protein
VRIGLDAGGIQSLGNEHEGWTRFSCKAPGEHYEWKATDPFLKKLPELIKAQQTKAKAEKN